MDVYFIPRTYLLDSQGRLPRYPVGLRGYVGVPMFKLHVFVAQRWKRKSPRENRGAPTSCFWIPRVAAVRSRRASPWCPRLSEFGGGWAADADAKLDLVSGSPDAMCAANQSQSE